jgi:hypothetical protein
VHEKRSHTLNLDMKPLHLSAPYSASNLDAVATEAFSITSYLNII